MSMSSKWQHYGRHWRQRLQNDDAFMRAARGSLALAGVLALDGWIDWQGEWMPVLLGVLASALTETDDGWRRRLQVQGLTLLAFALVAWTVAWALPQPLVLTGLLAVFAFVLTLFGALGERYRAMAFGSLVLFIYCILVSGGSRDQARMVLPWLLAGAAWYGCVSVMWSVLMPQAPVSHRLSRLYGLLGEYLRLKSLMFEPVREVDLAQRRMALALHNGRVVDALNTTKESLLSRLKQGRAQPWLQRAMQQYLVAQDIHERASSSHASYDVLADAFFHSDVLYRCQRVLALLGEQARGLSQAIRLQSEVTHQGATRRAIEDMHSAIVRVQADMPAHASVRALHALGENLTAMAGVLARASGPLDQGLDMRLSDRLPTNLSEAWARIRTQLRARSIFFRHASRLSLSLVFGAFIVHAQGDVHGYWILLTVVFVSQQQYAATLTRLVQRLFGTVAGLALGWALIRLFPQPLLQFVLMVTSGAVFLGSRHTRYWLATLAMTTFLLLSFHQMGMSQGVIPARFVDTLIGSAIAGLAAWLVLPNWQSQHWAQLAARTLRMQVRYLDALLDQYRTGRQDHLVYRIARRDAHLADAALSSAYSAMLREPSRVRLDAQVCGRFLLLSHMLLNYLSALGAHRDEWDARTTTLTPVMGMADALRQQLAAMALALEGGSVGKRRRASRASVDDGQVAMASVEASATTPAKPASETPLQGLLQAQLQLALDLTPEMRAQLQRLGAEVAQPTI